MDAVRDEYYSTLEMLNQAFFMVTAAHLAQDSVMYSKYHKEFFIHNDKCEELEKTINNLKNN